MNFIKIKKTGKIINDEKKELPSSLQEIVLIVIIEFF
jgi:hypothetical protein